MRLKRIDLYGFKSFARKTSVDLVPGITAIVGPNGCGKSNVVDALRWVMGEQRARHLRGKSMEDIIFAGTRQLAPLNVAEVSVTLSLDPLKPGAETDRLSDLPAIAAVYSEVTVTRKLHRSGDSEYQLNRQACRLKDIQSLFLAYGMGKQSFSIISQGNIGAITDASPDERRQYIEDAAGVSRYKQQRKEAEAKMAGAMANLDRLTDVIVEIETRMAELKHQAEKAAVYRATRDAMQEADAVVLVYQALAARQAAAEIQEALTASNRTLRVLESRLDALALRHTAIKTQRLTADYQIKEAAEQLSAAVRELDRMTGEQAFNQKELTRLQGEIAAANERTATLLEEKSALGDRISEAAQSCRELSQALSELTKTLTEARGKTGGKKDALEGYLAQIDEKKQAVATLIAEEARSLSRVEHAENTSADIKRQLVRTDTTIHTARGELDDLNRNRRALDAEGSELHAEADAVKAQIADAENHMREASKTVASLEDAIRKAERQLSECTARLDVLRAARKQREGFSEAARHILSIAEQADRQTTCLGLVADHIVPEDGYMEAAESALTNVLSAVLVNTADDAFYWIRQLQADHKGRALFIPVNTATDPIPEAPYSDTHLLTHLTVKHPDVRQILSRLLGHVRVETNADTAVARATDPAAPCAVVTPDGILVTPDGMIAGGAPAASGGLLSQNREIQTLQQTKTALERALSADRAAVSRHQADLDAIGKQRDLYITEHRQIEREQEKLNADIIRADQAIRHKKDQISTLTLDLERLEGDLVDVLEAVSAEREQLETCQRNKKETESAMDLLENQATHLRQLLEDAEIGIVTLKLDHREKAAQLTSETARHDDLCCQQAAVHDRLARHESEIVEKQRAAKSAAAAIDRLDTQIADQTLAVQTGETKLDELKTADRKQYDVQTELEAEISAVRSQLAAREKAHQVLETRETKTSLSLEALLARIEERHHQPVDTLKISIQTVLEAALNGEAVSTTEVPAGIRKLERKAVRLRRELADMGEVNPGAEKAYASQKERHAFLIHERDDVVNAVNDIREVIRRINQTTQERFLSMFTRINEKLCEVFPRLFEGGEAKLILTDPSDPLETGVEIMIQPPGKKLTRLSLLSGGEKALSAIAFVFSIFLLNPSAFCIIDEIDAPLDDANVIRFNELLKLIGNASQIIMITHNTKSMEFADTLVGVTMEKKGVTHIVPVNLKDAVSR